MRPTSKFDNLDINSVRSQCDANALFSSTLQNDWYQKKIVKKLKIVPNQNIIKRLIVGLNHAINHCPQTGCEYLVTLDLRESVKKRKLLKDICFQ